MFCSTCNRIISKLKQGYGKEKFASKAQKRHDKEGKGKISGEESWVERISKLGKGMVSVFQVFFEDNLFVLRYWLVNIKQQTKIYYLSFGKICLRKRL